MPTAVSTLRADFFSIPELLESRAQELPDSFEIVGVPDRHFNLQRYTYKQLDDASTRLAHHYTNSGLIAPRRSGDATSKLVVALMAPSSFEYVVTELALVKMGFCVLFVSTNNSAPAVAHLLNATSSICVVVAPACKDVVAQALSLRTEQDPSQTCKAVDMAPRSAWKSSSVPEPYVRALTPEQESPLPVFIVHSSGSTGFPKPIVITHKATLHNLKSNFGMTAFTTLPLYHNHGHACFYRALYSAKMLCLFPSEIPLTTANIYTALANAGPLDALFGVPLVLKLLSESGEAGIELLKQFKLVTYGGSACPTELGDALVKKHGVRLAGHYGSTEVGQLATSLRDFDTDKDWDYIRLKGTHVTSKIADFIRFEKHGDQLEVVVMDGWAGKVKSNNPDNSYSTSDLFIPHPTREGAYKFVGRLDDTLVQVNGEKTQPLSIELTLKGESPYIAEAVVFGAGRTHVGALILPTELARDKTPAELFPLIWPAIEKANADAPSHSQLVPEMLIYLSADTVIPKADKGSIIRPKTYKQFEAEIDELYRKYENGEAYVPGQEVTKQKLQGDDLVQYITKAITDALDVPASSLSADTDLFDFGVDSIKAARIRSGFQRDLDLGGRLLPGNLVFEQPSVDSLRRYLENVQSGQGVEEEVAAQQESQVAKMLELVEKYSHFAERPTVSGPAPTTSNRTVVLTGATGSLGAHLLHQMLDRDDVATVICLTRGKDHAEARTRVSDSLVTRGLPPLESNARVVAYAADLAQPDLGLGAETYATLQAAVTTIIHNGWAVNFTLNVESFENGNIKAAYQLLNLAITARQGHGADFFFSSSVSAVAAHKGRTIAEAVSRDPRDAQGMGYARSKWVTENIAANAARTRGIRAESFRIGQMVGDTVHGVWNVTEAISLLIKSAQTIGAMPDLNETLSWMPVDLAAKACIQAATAPASPTHDAVYHILNASKSTTWQTVHNAFSAKGIDFDVLPRREWVQRLRASDPDLKRNPTYKLVDFFAAKYDHDLNIARAEYLTSETSKISSVIAERPAVDEAVVGKFIDAWRKTGFLV